MERQSIEIDYCPQCRGVWLDRGELDKIIERSVAEQPVAARPVAPIRDERGDYSLRQPQRDSNDYRRDRDDDDDDYRHGKRRKKGGFLSEIFDFD